MDHTSRSKLGRYSAGMEANPGSDQNDRVGTFADGMTVTNDRLRMLSQHADAVSTLDAEQRKISEPVFEESVRAAYEYGASVEQIVEASRIEHQQVRRILTPAPSLLSSQE